MARQPSREKSGVLVAAGLGACSAAATTVFVSGVIAVLIDPGSGDRPWWQMILNALVGYIFLLPWLCLMATMVVIPPVLLLRLCRIDRFWAVLLLFLLISQLPEWIGALPPREGSSFSAYYRGCQAIIDNVVTPCGERLAQERQIYLLVTGAISSVTFYWTYRFYLRQPQATR